jgi:hypothetical protein
MGGGGKAESTPWRGPAGAQRPPHGGGYSALGTRGQSPWRSHSDKKYGGVSLPQPQRGTGTAPLHGVTPTDGVATSRAHDKAVARSAGPQSKRARDRRPIGKERGESARGAARQRRALRSAKRGTERVPRSSRSFHGRPSPCASDRHRQAGTLRAARWSKPAQTGLRNRARCGLARRRRNEISNFRTGLASEDNPHRSARPTIILDSRIT